MFNNGLDENTVLLKNFQINGTNFVNVIDKGQTPAQNKAMIESLYNTKTFTNFKSEVDAGNIIMTDVFVKDVQEPDPQNPSQIITFRITHAVAVVGYDQNNNMIFYDPAKGNFQIAPAGNLNQSYTIVITSTKRN